MRSCPILENPRLAAARPSRARGAHDASIRSARHHQRSLQGRRPIGDSDPIQRRKVRESRRFHRMERRGFELHRKYEKAAADWKTYERLRKEKAQKAEKEAKQ